MAYLDQMVQPDKMVTSIEIVQPVNMIQKVKTLQLVNIAPDGHGIQNDATGLNSSTRKKIQLV